MISTAKVALTIVKSDKFKKVVAIIVGFAFLILTGASMIFYYSSQGGSSALADQALAEYEYWQSHTVAQSPYSCQGEKYCKHFNCGTDEWCAYFVGYCADTVGIDLDEIKWSAACTPWISGLKSIDKYKAAGSYTPQRGNVIFFDYNGRAHHNATSWAQHVGVVVEINDNDTITVVCGNESGTVCTNSRINKYTIPLSSDSIACYGVIGTDVNIMPTALNTCVREIICRNETGSLYSECTSEFGSVVPNDVGALSIGVFGWHGNLALELLQTAYQHNPSQVNLILSSYGSAGSTVKSAIQNDYNWSSYIPSQEVSNCIRAILLSDAGKAAQDEFSLSYAQKYIDKCQENGLRDSKCIAYCSDILNQWGINSFDGGVLSGVDGSWSLERIYNSGRAWSDSNYNYYNRRTWTYNYIKYLK